MKMLKIISEARRRFGYEEKEYGKYSKHTRNVYKSDSKKNGKDSALGLIYLAESNLAKFLASKKKSVARKNIKKAKKIMGGEKNENLNGFYEYYVAHELFFDANFEKASEEFKKARNFLGINESFLKEIDFFIEVCVENTGKEEIGIKKVVKKWQDLELTFESENEAELFFTNKYEIIKTENFNMKIKCFIMRIEKLKNNVVNLMEKENLRMRCISAKFKALSSKISKFNEFLIENYIESDFIKLYYEDSKSLVLLFEILYEQSCGNLFRVAQIKNYIIPKTFIDMEEKINKCITAECIDVNGLRKYFQTYIVKKLTPQESNLKIPFLPVFYDLAFDYISYPEESQDEKNISSIFKKLTSFSF